LPSESQWEWAARGGVKSKGYRYSGGDDPFQVGVWGVGGRGVASKAVAKKSAEVASKLSNELGHFDMTGNVWELCQSGQTRGGGMVYVDGDFFDDYGRYIRLNTPDWSSYILGCYVWRSSSIYFYSLDSVYYDIRAYSQRQYLPGSTPVGFRVVLPPSS
jgi:formylglycine-generating enzyme required for sulfatase activity